MRLRLALLAALLAGPVYAQSGLPSVGGGAGNPVTATPTAAVGFPVPSALLVTTVTNVVVNTSPVVCPAADKVLSQVLQVQTGGAVGLHGQTLTSGTYATGAGAPDKVLSAANQELASPNAAPPKLVAWTFYGVAQIVICNQWTRP